MLSNNKKRNSWRHFCNKLNSKTQTQKVWKAIGKIKGKGGCNAINHLQINGNLITDKKEVAELLAKNLSVLRRIIILMNFRGLKCSKKNDAWTSLPKMRRSTTYLFQ